MQWFRRIVAFVFTGVALWQMCSIRALLSQIAATTSFRPVTYNEVVQKSVDLLVGQSGSWAQVTGLFLAVLGGLWVAKSEGPVLSFRLDRWPEIVTWGSGLFMLIAGLYCYNRYIASIAAAFEVGGTTAEGKIMIPDIFGPAYEGLRAQQFTLLLLGTLASASAVVLVRVLRGGSNVQEKNG